MNHQRCNTAQKIKNKYFAGFPSINEYEQLISCYCYPQPPPIFINKNYRKSQTYCCQRRETSYFFNENETWLDIFTF
jgi:hypothetical protein